MQRKKQNTESLKDTVAEHVFVHCGFWADLAFFGILLLRQIFVAKDVEIKVFDKVLEGKQLFWSLYLRFMTNCCIDCFFGLFGRFLVTRWLFHAHLSVKSSWVAFTNTLTSILLRLVYLSKWFRIHRETITSNATAGRWRLWPSGCRAFDTFKLPQRTHCIPVLLYYVRLFSSWQDFSLHICLILGIGCPFFVRSALFVAVLLWLHPVAWLWVALARFIGLCFLLFAFLDLVMRLLALAVVRSWIQIYGDHVFRVVVTINKHFVHWLAALVPVLKL